MSQLDPVRWEKPALKLLAYLEAHGFHARVATDRLLYSILQQTDAAQPDACAEDLEKLVIDHAETRMADWFRTTSDDPRAQPLRGRLALFLNTDPGLHLRLAQTSGSGAISATAHSINPGPGIRLSSMRPHPIELGLISTLAGETKKFLERATLLRIAATWLVFAGILALLFAWTR